MKYLMYALVVILSPSSNATTQMFVWGEQSGMVPPPENCERSLEEIKNPTALDRREVSLKINEILHFFPANSHLEQKMEGERTVKLICGEKIYFVFEVYSPERPEPISQVALEPAVSNFVAQISQFKETTEKISATNLPAGIPVIEGSLDQLICNPGENIDVFDQGLFKVLFKVKTYERVRRVQSFGGDHQTKDIDGEKVTFIKVAFPSRHAGNNMGWVNEKNLKTSSQCPGFVEKTAETALLSGETWTFPTITRATDSYKTGMRRFSAARSGGARLHAACDLYRITNEQALAVSSGQVIRDRYYFYQGTYAIEVRHPGGKIARYGEITGKSAPGVKLNSTVKSGQPVGYIGKVNSNCCNPMLHFEFYSGTATGPLSQAGNKFQRRKDLVDPTDILAEWEKLKFGISY